MSNILELNTLPHTKDRLSPVHLEMLIVLSCHNLGLHHKYNQLFLFSVHKYKIRSECGMRDLWFSLARRKSTFIYLLEIIIFTLWMLFLVGVCELKFIYIYKYVNIHVILIFILCAYLCMNFSLTHPRTGRPQRSNPNLDMLLPIMFQVSMHS